MQILGRDIVSKMISTLKTSVETMLRVLTAGADADGEGGKGNNASFADMGTAIDAVVGGIVLSSFYDIFSGSWMDNDVKLTNYHRGREQQR